MEKVSSCDCFSQECLHAHSLHSSSFSVSFHILLVFYHNKNGLFLCSSLLKSVLTFNFLFSEWLSLHSSSPISQYILSAFAGGATKNAAGELSFEGYEQWMRERIIGHRPYNRMEKWVVRVRERETISVQLFLTLICTLLVVHRQMNTCFDKFILDRQNRTVGVARAFITIFLTSSFNKSISLFILKALADNPLICFIFLWLWLTFLSYH